MRNQKREALCCSYSYLAHTTETPHSRRRSQHEVATAREREESAGHFPGIASLTSSQSTQVLAPIATRKVKSVHAPRSGPIDGVSLGYLSSYSFYSLILFAH